MLVEYTQDGPEAIPEEDSSLNSRTEGDVDHESSATTMTGDMAATVSRSMAKRKKSERDC